MESRREGLVLGEVMHPEPWPRYWKCYRAGSIWYLALG